MNIMNQMAINGIKYVEAIPPGKAKGILSQIYNQIEHDFAIAPPFTLHSAIPELVAAVWSAERETMFHGIVPRGIKESIVAAVAIINECPYCIDAHTLMMQASDEGVAAKEMTGESGKITDSKIQQLTDWAKATCTPGADILANPPFTLDEAPEIIGAALAFHYINRMANVFLDDHMVPKMGFFSGAVRNMMANTMIKSMLQRKIEPGASIQFLPDGHLPDEFRWAKQNEILSRTFAGITAVMDQYAGEQFSQTALDTVRKKINTWHGQDMGMSRKWINEATEGLNEMDTVATRLMLLASLASYQVTETDIEQFQQHYPTDVAVIAATAWGAWTAVRRISTWLQTEPQKVKELLVQQ